MSPSSQVLLSGALTFGVPLLLAVRELITLRRWTDEPDERDGSAEPAPPPPPRGGTPAAKPLPACLIPERRPVFAPERRAEQLETV